MKAQAAKRDSNPDDEAGRLNFCFRIPQCVPGVVGSLSFGVKGVSLNASWINVENEGVALVAKSVKRDFNVVV